MPLETPVLVGSFKRQQVVWLTRPYFHFLGLILFLPTVAITVMITSRIVTIIITIANTNLVLVFLLMPISL